MPGSYRTHGIVLRRTKLGEQDLIVTLLGDGASQLRIVAKGARKPGSRLSGVVNLGNEVDLLAHRGHGLDVASEGSLVVSRAGAAREFERSAMLEAVLDVAGELTVEGEHNRMLAPMTSTALDAVCAAPVSRLPLVGAAYVIKAAAMQGYRPSFDACVMCGGPAGAQAGSACGFSFVEGGAVCSDCMAQTESVNASVRMIDAALLAWWQALLHMTFAQLLAMDVVQESDEARLGLDVLELCREWLGHYPGVRPRALDFVLDRGLWSLVALSSGGEAL